ncbi:MAG: insulinase family protein [Paludibacteraceae bacterium]|nr:insulinase family protein [Paludibacteraceae bacterium]
MEKIHINTTSYFTFPSGIRLVHRLCTSPVAYLGIMVGAGTRDEKSAENGMAHFIEHTVFKGVQHRLKQLNSRQIINRVEAIGGEINAYTTKEETTYYVAAPADCSARVMDLLAEMVFAPTFPKEELQKEKGVIYDEIESYNDSPSELIYDDFESLVFAGHSLAQPILGAKKTLRYFTPEKARTFMHRTYLPHKMVVFVESNMPFLKVLKMVEKMVEPHALQARLERVPEAVKIEENGSSGLEAVLKPSSCDLPADLSAAVLTPDETDSDCKNTSSSDESFSHLLEYHKHTHQTHVMMGGLAYPLGHERQLSLYLLNNILAGGAMNSMLNLQLREQRGLVYTVDSIYTPLSDTGYWSVYFASDPENRHECERLVLKTLAQLREKPLSDSMLRSRVRQLKGQMAIAAENRENNVLSMAKQMLYYGYVPTLADTMGKIERLTPHDLHVVAQQVFAPSSLYILRYI